MNKVLCASCGRVSATARTLRKYHYLESGLDNLWLHGGVLETKCAHCGETMIRIEKEGQLLQVIAMALLMSPPGLTGSEMRFIRGACLLSQAELAEALRVPRRETVAEREARRHSSLSFAEELGLRVVLLSAFIKHLQVDRNRLLSDHHWKQLLSFANDLCDFAESETKRAKRLQVTLDGSDWKMAA